MSIGCALTNLKCRSFDLKLEKTSYESSLTSLDFQEGRQKEGLNSLVVRNLHFRFN